MGEQTFVVRPYGVRYMCEVCGGEMNYTNKMLMTDPPKFEHACACGIKVNLAEKYPTVRWETDVVPPSKGYEYSASTGDSDTTIGREGDW